jgi:ABC-type sugar transport system ATPase subunit
VSSAIAVAGVSKRYGATAALTGIDLDVPAGTIHALVGENGAGKSTLLGILAGRVEPTEGEVRVFGEPATFGSPRAAHAAGIVAIYQELTIVPALSAVANVFLGQTLARHGLLSERVMRERFRALCERLNVSIAPDVPARRLSVADQQLLEIMRALQAQARIILFDEPTAPLAPPEREGLFRVMRDLRADGVTMLFVSHNLDEVLDLADDVTVFRDGRRTQSGPAAEQTKTSLIAAMLGDAGHDAVAASATDGSGTVRRRRAARSELLRVQDVTVRGALAGARLTVHAGEIVGIGGLVGSGRSTLLRALAGLVRPAEGEMFVAGVPVRWPRTVRESLRHGIALLPEDRKDQGLVLGRSAMENITLAALDKVARGTVISERSMRRAATAAAEPYGFDPRRLDETARNLSGGNQQKLLLARWAHRPPRVLLADEPTRGIDVGAKAEILDTLRGLAAQGLAVVLVSSELEEVAAIADRVVVLSHGRHAGELDGAERPITVKDILHVGFEVREIHA